MKRKKEISSLVADYVDFVFQPGDGGIHPGRRWILKRAKEIVKLVKTGKPLPFMS